MRWYKQAILAGSVSILLATAIGVALSDTGPEADPDTWAIGDGELEALKEMRIPVRLEPTDEHACNALRNAFDNPIAGYSLCYPDAWRFVDLTSAEPLTMIDGVRAADIRLASEAAFPWTPGQFPTDAVAPGIVVIEVTTVPAFTPNSETGDCNPDARLPGGTRFCEVRIDPSSLIPAKSGLVLEILALTEIQDGVVISRAYLQPDAALRQLTLDILGSIRPLQK